MESDPRSSTQLKQIFLRQQIIDKGYNPQDFLQLLTTLKQGGQNIELWSLTELQQTVVRFRQIAKYIPVRDSRLPKEQIPTNNNNNKATACKKFERFLERHLVNLDVIIEKPEIVTKGGFMGFGATSVLYYSLKTSIVVNEVKRADTDFDWLRSTLIRFHPNRIIPSLEKSKSILPDDTKALFKRGQMIKLFIQNLSKCEPLFNCKITIAFLTWGDYPRFESFKKDMTAEMSALTPNEFITKTGVLESELSHQNTNTIKHINNYNNSVKEAYQEIRGTIKEIQKNFEDLTASIYRIGNSFATLQEKHSDLISTIPELNDEKFNETMIGFNNCVHEWGKTFNLRRKAVQKHLSLMFKYTNEQAETIEKVLKRRSIIQDQYTKLRIQLHKKKEKLASSNPQLKKINIPHLIVQPITIDQIKHEQLNKLIPITQFNAQSNLRQMLGTINASVVSEFKRLQPIIIDRMMVAFKNLGQATLDAAKSQTEVSARFINGTY